MSDATADPGKIEGPTPDDPLAQAKALDNVDAQGRMLAADGTPLKKSLARSLRIQKLRALMLIAPLLLFVLLTFVAPIADMLFRSVENQIVSDTLPRTVEALQDWDYESGEAPDEPVFDALYDDLFLAAERREHTRLGSRLNYETTGISSLFRQTGRSVEDLGDAYLDQFEELNEAWEEEVVWAELMGSDQWLEEQRAWDEESGDPLPEFQLREGVATLLPETTRSFLNFVEFIRTEDQESPLDEEPWSRVYTGLYTDLMNEDVANYSGPHAELLQEADAAVADFETQTTKEFFLSVDEDWGDPRIWGTLEAFSPNYTSGYFLNAVDMQLTPEGAGLRDEDERIYGLLFKRTMFMSLVITFSCILLGYPIAYLLANLPMRSANLLMILVLLPFWTSLLVRTSAWKVMLQQQGVINDVLVWLGLVGDANRLVMINNQFGTIVAMTHILLPFMILPMYSVMSTIPPSYVRAAKSLGATNVTAFRRVYFPQSVPGIGAGSILVFILAIGYYITPEIVGGTTGTFISNRIAYHISSSLNWGLAAALGTILLAVVLILYWAYDRIVGIDNVKLGG
ncbi:Spermidine/putrescine transport system permease protein PotB [Roseivivax jejudonensis]|uniref:Spermidine/putrescine transport system permease protein PotB n=1 Tax=Roseivivax jejudonensis TaxID=1529041 RepID=A0A1X6ZQK4_9RHOB|nr:ABC transporter permease [Roseivivax jejudonensis]SLN58280.1 Spermidine/putrescine transport system permease protein PotB [Roseivivax jejudonensis]